MLPVALRIKASVEPLCNLASASSSSSYHTPKLLARDALATWQSCVFLGFTKPASILEACLLLLLSGSLFLCFSSAWLFLILWVSAQGSCPWRRSPFVKRFCSAVTEPNIFFFHRTYHSLFFFFCQFVICFLLGTWKGQGLSLFYLLLHPQHLSEGLATGTNPKSTCWLNGWEGQVLRHLGAEPKSCCLRPLEPDSHFITSLRLGLPTCKNERRDTCVHSSILHNGQKMEASRWASADGWGKKGSPSMRWSSSQPQKGKKRWHMLPPGWTLRMANEVREVSYKKQMG